MAKGEVVKERLPAVMVWLIVAAMAWAIGYMSGVEHPTAEAIVSDCANHGLFVSNDVSWACYRLSK